MSTCPRLRLSPDGPEFSRLVYGTWRLLNDLTATPEDLLLRLRTCLDLGITTLDTAEIYGRYRVEEFLGQTLARDPELRAKFEIVTKAGIYIPCEFHPERKTPFYNATADRLVKSAEKSLRLLGVDQIDLFLVHRPDWLASADETAEGLNRLLRQGKIRAAGVSNYNVHQFALLQSRMERPLVTNQVEFSLLHTDAIHDGTLDQCQLHRIHPMAWSPLGGGKMMTGQTDVSRRLLEAAADLSDAYGGASLDQLAYAWILAHPSQPLAVIGTNQASRLAPLVKATDLRLEREHWYALWTAAKGHTIP